MQHGLLESRIAPVTVPLPIPHVEIQLNRTGLQLTVDSHGRLGEIRTCGTIPVPELNDLDPFTLRADKLPSEFTSKPARLNFQLRL